MTSAPSADASARQPDEAPAWLPDERYRDRSRLLRFMNRHGLGSYEDLLARANRDPAWYWGAVADDLGLTWTRPYREVLDLSRGTPWAEWFVDGGFNYVTNALDHHASAPDGDRTAVIWEGDDGAVRRLSYRQLQAEVNRLANGLRALGVNRGDRVGVFMPMLPETAIAVLALGKLGTVFVPMFSGFGPEALASRLRDAEASVLIMADSSFRRGHRIDLKAIADAALANAPSVHTCVVVRRTDDDHLLAGGSGCQLARRRGRCFNGIHSRRDGRQ